MSEDEIIKFIKEKIKNTVPEYTETLVDGKIYRNEIIPIEMKWTKQVAEKVQGLLDLYNKEKENNKELDRENQALYESINCDDNTMLAKLYQKEKEKNKELTDEYLIQRNLINAEFLNENYISKDKIKAKIEELEKEKSKYTGYKGLEISRTGLINAQKLVLQELLEERK